MAFLNFSAHFAPRMSYSKNSPRRVQSSLNLLNRVLVISISQLSVFLPPPHPNLAFFLVASLSLEGGKWDLKPVWGAALCIAQPRKYSLQKKGRGNISPSCWDQELSLHRQDRKGWLWSSCALYTEFKWPLNSQQLQA